MNYICHDQTTCEGFFGLPHILHGVVVFFAPIVLMHEDLIFGRRSRTPSKKALYTLFKRNKLGGLVFVYC